MRFKCEWEKDLCKLFSSKDFLFYSAHLRTNKKVLALCMGNHELYMRRRRPDSIEVQQMKVSAAEQRTVRDAERMALERERAAREELDRQRTQLEQMLKDFELREKKARDEVSLIFSFFFFLIFTASSNSRKKLYMYHLFRSY